MTFKHSFESCANVNLIPKPSVDTARPQLFRKKTDFVLSIILKRSMVTALFFYGKSTPHGWPSPSPKQGSDTSKVHIN